MLVFRQIPVIIKQSFQSIRRTFHEFLFQNDSKDIPGILYYENNFIKSKSSKNCFVGYPVKILTLAVSSLEMLFWTLLKPLLSIPNIIIIVMNIFCQVFNVSVCSAQQKIFVTACTFDMCNLTTCYKNLLIAVITVARYYQRELLNLPAIGHLPVNKSQ